MRGIYLMAGYPSFDVFEKALKIAEEKGFQFAEIGVPFSDPVADGPVIARAAKRAIESGVNLKKVVEFLREKSFGLKLYLMAYANTLWAYGLKRLTEELNGRIEGVIIPDLPNEERDFFVSHGLGLEIIGFATPESSLEDLTKLAKLQKKGFIYFVSLRGITGQTFSLDEETKKKLAFIREKASVPVILGFGIKTKQDVEKAIKIADGFVAGTEAIRRLEKGLFEFESWCSEII